MNAAEPDPTAGEPPSFYRTSTDVDADLDALTAEPDAGDVEALAEPYAALLVILARVRCQALHGQANGGRCVNCMSWAKRIGGPEHLPRLNAGLDAVRRKAGDERAEQIAQAIYADRTPTDPVGVHPWQHRAARTARESR